MARKKPGRSSEPAGDRARGRELALLAMCHLESYALEEREEAIEVFWRDLPGSDEVQEFKDWRERPKVREFAKQLLLHILRDWSEVDAAIEETSKAWRIARMDRVDRNVLRLTFIELQTYPDTPKGVILAESVRLASRYGSERSAAFVNGLAESLSRRLRPPN